MNSTGYNRLFLMRVVNRNNPTSNLIYILEDDIKHANLWNSHLSIKDNGGITIGSIICFFMPIPYENIMPDDVPEIESQFPVAVMKTPLTLRQVRIDYTIQGGESMAFSLNNCKIIPLALQKTWDMEDFFVTNRGHLRCRDTTKDVHLIFIIGSALT